MYDQHVIDYRRWYFVHAAHYFVPYRLTWSQWEKHWRNR